MWQKQHPVGNYSHWPGVLLLQLTRVWGEEFHCQSKQGVCWSWKNMWADLQNPHTSPRGANNGLMFELAYFWLASRRVLWVPAKPVSKTIHNFTKEKCHDIKNWLNAERAHVVQMLTMFSNNNQCLYPVRLHRNERSRFFISFSSFLFPVACFSSRNQALVKSQRAPTPLPG